MNEQIWKYIAELSTPGFFVTADIMYEGEEFPVDIKAFIIDKLVRGEKRCVSKFGRSEKS